MRLIHLILAVLFAASLPACSKKTLGPMRSVATPDGVRTTVDRGLQLTWSGDADAQLPLSLTASDGTGLQLVSMSARAVVDGPLAFTELHMVFDNPQDRQREGRFEITLPPSAAVSRFAMRIDDHWQEAEVVERQAARVAYEDFLHRRQDPALLEKKAGNQFRARVFPIAAGAQKEIIVSYSEQLAGADASYRLALAGLPTIERLDVEIQVPGEGRKVRKAKAKARKPTDLKDVALRIEPTKQARPAQGLRFETLAMGRVVPRLKLSPAAMTDLTIAFDTSGSRALAYDAQVGRLTALIAALRKGGDEFALRVVAFDQDVAEIYSGPASGFGKAHAGKLSERMALGASDLSRLLDWLAANPGAAKGDRRVIMYGDGVVTAGERDAAELGKLATALGDRGYTRIDAVVDGGIRDEAALGALVNAGLKSTGVVLDAGGPDVATRLLSQTRSGVKITVPGAEWSWPIQADGLQDGDELLVFAHLPIGTEMRVVLEGIDDAPEPLTLRETQRPLLERAWVASDIARMTAKLGNPETDAAKKAKLNQRILELSVAHRVLSDLTALLVLETEEDYARFKIDRTALSDILTVGTRGVELRGREQLAKKTPTRVFVRKAPTVTPRGQRRDEAPPEDLEEHAGERAMREEGTMGRRGRTDSADEPQEAREAHEMPADGRDQPRRRMRAAPPAAIAPDEISRTRMAAADVIAHAPSIAPATAAPSAGRHATGRNADDNLGAGALALRGTGRGGGGTGHGTIGLGNLGTIGHGGGSAAGLAYGRSAGSMRGLRASVPRVRLGAPVVGGSLSKEVIRRIIRRHINEVRFCYEQRLRAVPSLTGRVDVKFVIAPDGGVRAASVARSTAGDPGVERCIVSAVRRWNFPSPGGGGIVPVTYPFFLEFSRPGEAGGSTSIAVARPRPRPQPQPQHEQPAQENAYSGSFGEAMAMLAEGKHEAARQLALAWRKESPGDVLALVALGESFEASEQPVQAARVYGTLIDLFPSRADLRRMAAERLDRLGEAGQALALDSYRVAVEQRPDHPSSHRLYGYALLQEGRFADAFAAIEAGFSRKYPDGRFADVTHILGEDLGLIGAAWVAASPDEAVAVRAKLEALGLSLADKPSTRFVLHWETDANDVDLHVYDRNNDHAFFSHRPMASGGKLYADVTTGYGPECFAVAGKPTAYPYTFQAHYYSRGPMGYGMGKLQIIQHDGKGKLFMQHRPFVVMNDKAYVNLGTLDGPLPSVAKAAPIQQLAKDTYVPPAPEL